MRSKAAFASKTDSHSLLAGPRNAWGHDMLSPFALAFASARPSRGLGRVSVAAHTVLVLSAVSWRRMDLACPS